MQNEDYYEILGVSRNASKIKIRDAYRRLAHYYHPDRNKSSEAEERFKRTSEAYAVLSDDEERQEYDDVIRQEIDNQFCYSETDSGYMSEDFLQGSPSASKSAKLLFPRAVVIVLCISIITTFTTIWYVLSDSKQIIWMPGGVSSTISILPHLMLVLVVTVPIIADVAVVFHRYRKSKPEGTDTAKRFVSPTGDQVDYCRSCGALIISRNTSPQEVPAEYYVCRSY